jgi:hypothetical protein
VVVENLQAVLGAPYCPTEPGFFDAFLCTVSAISLDSVSVNAQPQGQSRHQRKALGLSVRRIAMSKAQKGNKENKKPKVDKSQSKANVSAYKAAQGQGKPASSPFAKKT